MKEEAKHFWMFVWAGESVGSMRIKPFFAGLLVAFAPALASDNASLPSKTACDAIAHSLPSRGTRLSAKAIDEAIADLPGSSLSLQAKAMQGLVLESTYAGSLGCQRNVFLFGTTDGRRAPIQIPDGLQGGEGTLCGPDKVKLIAVNHTPALMETNGVDLNITMRRGSDWITPCKISIETNPHYGITERYCKGFLCDALESVAVKSAEWRRTGALSLGELRASEMSREKQETWVKYKAIADKRQLIADELPTLGQENTTGNIHSFIVYDREFIPIQIGNDLLLGKTGTAGFGDHFGTDTLFAAYRLVGDQFQPVAGFYLSVQSRSLAGYRVTNPSRP